MSWKETSENIVLEEAIDKTIQHVERGGRLEQPLRDADIFPDVVVDMIAIGEEAGKLDLMLFKVADLYDGGNRQIDQYAGLLFAAYFDRGVRILDSVLLRQPCFGRISRWRRCWDLDCKMVRRMVTERGRSSEAREERDQGKRLQRTIVLLSWCFFLRPV